MSVVAERNNFLFHSHSCTRHRCLGAWGGGGGVTLLTWDGVRKSVRVFRDERVLDVSPTDSMGTWRHNIDVLHLTGGSLIKGSKILVSKIGKK